MSYNDLVIINNEKISNEKNSFYCDNIDIKSIPENLNKNFDVTVIARNSKIKRSHEISLQKIKIASNIFNFLFSILKTFKKNKASYLIISITPYTFFSYLLLFFFRKKIFVYLRSNGHEEYKAILGFIGPIIYNIMFIIVTSGSNIISCQNRLAKKKSSIIFPSELDDSWLQNTSKPLLDKPRLLYIGRIKVEKGIFSLFEILHKFENNFELSIVGKVESKTTNSSKIKYFGGGFNSEKLKKIYDEHNIFILPSFTEAHPQVVDEALSRNRPIIIFQEIEHIIQNRIGIFVSKRNKKSLLDTIEFIMKNYSTIQNNMVKNQLPTKKEFLFKMTSILKN